MQFQTSCTHLTAPDCVMQDECGNQVEAQETHHESLRLSVTGALKEEGEPSQLQELLLDAQVIHREPILPVGRLY